MEGEFFRRSRLQELRGFCCAAQTGSISRAADRLGLTQPSISLQIQALERELGVTLFERRGPRIRLTTEGLTLLELARPLVEQLEALPRTFAQLRGEVERGSLEVMSGESFLLYVLPPVLARFSRSYPQVRIRLRNVVGGMLPLERLRNDEVDLALGTLTNIPEDISYRPLLSYPMVAIMAPEHPLAALRQPTLRDICAHDLILPSRGSQTRDEFERVVNQHHFQCRVPVETSSWAVMKRYAELGLAVALVSGICVRHSDRLRIVPMDQYLAIRVYGVVTRRGKFLSPQAQRFIEMLQADAGPASPKAGLPRD